MYCYYSASYQAYYGNPVFVDDDLSTYWAEPHQFFTWWKNNIERRYIMPLVLCYVMSTHTGDHNVRRLQCAFTRGTIIMMTMYAYNDGDTVR